MFVRFRAVLRTGIRSLTGAALVCGGCAASEISAAPLSVEDAADRPAERGGVKWVTLSSPDDFLVVNGNIVSAAGYPNVEAAPLELDGSEPGLTRVRFTEPGFYSLSVLKPGLGEQRYAIFVSPVPTVHAGAAEENRNWYRTQFNTGTSSNCGPASVSMVIAWVTGKNVPVSSVRRAVGWRGIGGTSFEELLKVITGEGAGAAMLPIQNARNIREVINAGGIAVVLINTGGISAAAGDPGRNLFGRYYDDSMGHYIVVKGYSLNGEYFVVYDPIPGDWSSNRFRYGDELSMIGRNRYYSAEELIRSLRRPVMIAAPVPDQGFNSQGPHREARKQYAPIPRSPQLHKRGEQHREHGEQGGNGKDIYPKGKRARGGFFCA